MTAPDFMPVLSGGGHTNPQEGACLMEYVSILAGEPFSDSPACTDLSLANVGRQANDTLSTENRRLLLPFIGRLMGTRSMTTAEYHQWVRRMVAEVPCNCGFLCYGWAVPQGGLDALRCLSFALDAYDDITGRTSHRDLTADDYRILAGAVSS